MKFISKVLILAMLITSLSVSFVMADNTKNFQNKQNLSFYEMCKQDQGVELSNEQRILNGREYKLTWYDGTVSTVSETNGLNGEIKYNVIEGNLVDEVIVYADNTVSLNGKTVTVTANQTSKSQVVTRAQGTWIYSAGYIDGVSLFNSSVSTTYYDVALQQQWISISLTILSIIMAPFVPQLSALTSLFSQAMMNYRTYMIVNQPYKNYGYVKIVTTRYNGSTNPQYYCFTNTFYANKNASGTYIDSVGIYLSFGRLTYN